MIAIRSLDAQPAGPAASPRPPQQQGVPHPKQDVRLCGAYGVHTGRGILE